MLGELNSESLRGLSFEEYQENFIRLVKYYVSYYYPKNPALRFNGYDKEDLATEVYCRLYNRKDKNSPSNAEKYFIIASTKGETAPTYISQVVKKIVVTCLMDIHKRINSVKRGSYTLFSDQIIDQNEFGFTEGFTFEFGKNRLEWGRDSISYFELIESLPLRVYEKYYVLRNGRKLQATSRIILDMLVDGYTQGELSEYIRDIKTNEGISLFVARRLKSEVIDLAKRTFKDYQSEILSYNTIRR